MLLQGHMHLIHDLNWRSSSNSENSSVKFLVSASSDYTAMVWIINKKDKSYSYVILPHPSFVYASIILSSNHKQLTVVTGGRDQILRLWKISLKTVFK
jgi:WD40 repeat protein